MNPITEPGVIESTAEVKSIIRNLGIDLAGFVNLNELNGIPLGLNINRSQFFQQFPYAIVLGAQYAKLGKKASGDETAVYLEKIAYEITDYLEKRHYKHLIIHPDDEFDYEKRMGLISLKVLAKQAGIGWQGRSLLIVSPEYGPVHRLIAVLTNMKLNTDKPIKNLCGDCTDCIDKCPENSLVLRRFEDHPDSREEVLDLKTCLGDNGCLICIIKCPYLLEYRKKVKYST
jgi:epoxyqueuosine reductase